MGVFGYDDVREAERAAEEAEVRRLHYVAMTRAIDRLIVAGSLDPSRRDRSRSLIGWTLDRLSANLDQEHLELPGGEKILLHVDRRAEATTAVAARARAAGALRPAQRGAGRRVRAAAAPGRAGARPERIRRLSYSALALLERCSYRFYLERFVGLRPEEDAGRGRGAGGLARPRWGTPCMRSSRRAQPEAAAAATSGCAGVLACSRRGHGARSALVAAWRESVLAADLAGLAGIRPELAFAFEHDGVLLTDASISSGPRGERALVVDYKTDRLDDLPAPERSSGEYRVQRLVYALAALRAGVEEVDVIFSFLERADDPVAAKILARRPARARG